jgi:hypothetical protein
MHDEQSDEVPPGGRESGNARKNHNGWTTGPEAADKFYFEPPTARPNIKFKRSRRTREQLLPQSRGRKKAKWYRQRTVILAMIPVLILAAGGWIGLQGWRAGGDLRAVPNLFAELQKTVQAGDLTGARAVLSQLQVKTAAARGDTDGWLWGLGTHIPAVGGDLAAVRTVSDVLDSLSREALPALLDIATVLDPAKLSAKKGQIDPATLSDAAPKLAQGLASIRASKARISAIPLADLNGRLSTAVQQLSAGLAKAEQLIATADRAARLLPTMLGADGPRSYLVLFQNLAEARATGGIPGAYLVLKADDGAIKIIDQGSTSTMRPFSEPVLTLEPEMDALYTDRPATFLQDVNLTPDFPTVALLARRMYQLKSGRNVDGVLATDPVALSYLLTAVGSVSMPTGESLTAGNAVRLLLSEAYAKYPNPDDQDKYFSTAARATFEKLLTSGRDRREIVTQLAKAAGERRLLVWSADKREEKILGGTVLAGQLPIDDGTAPTVGVFLNDGGGSKLSYYLTRTADLSVGACDEDGSRQLHLKLTVGSTASSSGLPAYVTGLALSGDPYTSRTNIMVFSPTGGGVVTATSDGKEVGIGTGIEKGRGVGIITADLKPGERRTYDFTIQTAPMPAGAPLYPRLRTTPGVQPWRIAVHPSTGCPS